LKDNKSNTKLFPKILEFNFVKFYEESLLKVYELTRFGIRYLKEVFFPPYNFKEFIRQLFLIGYKSLSLIGLVSFILGFTLTLQTFPTLGKFGAESLVPSMVAISFVREIGPVITALIFTGKIGSGIGAELGSMKVTEQIDAMEVSATNPFHYLVVTRITATTLMLPCLVIYADAIALIGSYIAVNIMGGMSLELFYSNVFSSLSFDDVLPATIKTFFFGFTVGLVGCYEGYNTSGGTASVGKATVTTVVIASLLVIIEDMIVVQISTIFF
jgi:phospholipid/cholesterol/gamma-HCH transport system permease protein